MPFPVANPALLRAVTEKGYLEPTSVQSAVLAPELAGRDLLVSAQTGSGKTVAFGLAMGDTLLGTAERFTTAGAPMGLVIAPTRELAMQVQRELEWLYAKAGGIVVACVGGMDVRREQRTLDRGAHLVVGTPGRLCDHLDRGVLKLGAIRTVVLDEADEMLDLGFRDELERLLQATPGERRTLMFSATVPRPIETLAKAFQRDAARVATVAAREPHGDIDYRAVLIAPMEREHAVVNVLRFLDEKGALVFCATREAVHHLHGNLVERGFAAVSLSGELNQNERNRALQSLRDGRARVCVATDVAARGLDLPDLGVVIHTDVPRATDTLLHRSGRTGRAGRKGVAVVLVPFNRRRAADRLFAEAGVHPTWLAPPSAEAIRAKDEERLLAEIGAMPTEPTEEDLVLARKLLTDHEAERLVAELVRSRRGLLPAPEEVTASVMAPKGPRPPRDTAPVDEGVAWFRVNVGRAENADPRWIVPLLCRRGRVSNQVIGKIKILEHETRFEINLAAADEFHAAVLRPDRKEPGIRFQRYQGR